MKVEKVVQLRHCLALWLSALTISVMTGCGGGSGGSGGSSTPTANRTIPAANNPVAPAAAVGNNPKQNRTDSARPGSSGNTTSVAAKPLPPGTDPDSVFYVSPAPRLEVQKSEPQPEDQFEIQSGVKGTDSSKFIVAAIEAPAQTFPKGNFTLPSGFVAVPNSGYAENGWPLRIRCEKTESVLALVPAGAAIIGTNAGPSESQPEFSVHLDSFYMEIYEVSVDEFEKYRQEMKEKKKPIPQTPGASTTPTMPLVGVPWGVAQTFAKWAGMDLPTEAEFEKASRGPNSLRTPWGDGRAVWPKVRTTSTITRIGAFSTDVSPYGIYDLAGNVREWCTDFYSDQAHREALGTNNHAPHNWSGPKKNLNTNLRVVKGNGADWSAWHRAGREIGKGFPDVGFRCVLRVAAQEAKASD